MTPGNAAIIVANTGPAFDPCGISALTTIPRKVMSGLRQTMRRMAKNPLLINPGERLPYCPKQLGRIARGIKLRP
jgi:hypothetical protein